MKLFIGLFVGMIFLLSFQLHAFGVDSSKIGVVDMQKLQLKSKAFQVIKEKYMKKAQSLQKRLENEKNNVLALEEELKKQSMMLSLDAKEDKRKELGKKTRHYKYLQEEFLQEMKEAEVEAVRSVGTEIAKIVAEIGKAQGYLMILEKRAVGFLYNSEEIDITDHVIEAYDKMKQ